MMPALKIDDASLKMLRQHVMVDSEISESERRRSLDAIARVKQGIDSGEFTVVDRTQLIKKAAERKQGTAFCKKLKAKSRKVRRNATEDTRTIKSLDAFDEKFMYSSDEEVRRYADGMGITDVYKETKRFDEEWN